MRKLNPPGFAQALIRFIVRDNDEQASVLGDLEETFASTCAKLGRTRAVRSYWKETIVTTAFAVLRRIEKHRVAAFTLALGILGGVALIALPLLTRRGSFVFFIYAGLMAVMTVYLRLMQVDSFWRRFLLILTAFMTMTLLMSCFIAAIDDDVQRLPLWRYALGIGFAVVLGSATATVVAAFSGRRSSSFVIFPFVPVIASAWLAMVRPAESVRRLFHGILPFTFFVNWRRDGWAWGFAGLDVLLWSAIGWLLFEAWCRTQKDHRTAPE